MYAVASRLSQLQLVVNVLEFQGQLSMIYFSENWVKRTDSEAD